MAAGEGDYKGVDGGGQRAAAQVDGAAENVVEEGEAPQRLRALEETRGESGITATGSAARRGRRRRERRCWSPRAR